MPQFVLEPATGSSRSRDGAEDLGCGIRSYYVPLGEE
jgi:hypothetical protein